MLTKYKIVNATVWGTGGEGWFSSSFLQKRYKENIKNYKRWCLGITTIAIIIIFVGGSGSMCTT